MVFKACDHRLIQGGLALADINNSNNNSNNNVLIGTKVPTNSNPCASAAVNLGIGEKTVQKPKQPKESMKVKFFVKKFSCVNKVYEYSVNSTFGDMKEFVIKATLKEILDTGRK